LIKINFIKSIDIDSYNQFELKIEEYIQ